METYLQVSGLKTQVGKLEEEIRIQAARYTEVSEECEQHKLVINKMRWDMLLFILTND